MRFTILLTAVTGLVPSLLGCSDQPATKEIVVVRVAVDDIHSRPILEAFARETGIIVDATYDTEQSKTVGHVTQLVAEQEAGNPTCDVFWNNEIINTIHLKNRGMLQMYVPGGDAQEIPPTFRDPDGTWIGFGARARIIVVNTKLIPNEADRPTSYRDFLDPRWKQKCTVARPETGTTLTHGVAMFTALAENPSESERLAREFWEGVRANAVIAQSNGQTMGQVRDRHMAFGFTDTDDFQHGVEHFRERGEEVEIVAIYPDQDGVGTLLIPNTVCIMKGAPHLDAAKRLVDYLSSKRVEAELANSVSRQIPVRADVPAPESTRKPSRDFKAMEVDWDAMGAEFTKRAAELREK